MTSLNGHTNDDKVPTSVQTIASLIDDFGSQIPRIHEDNGVIQSLVNALLSGGIVDDRQ
jgi:hypothetical protein